MEVVSQDIKIFLTFFIIFSFFIYWSTWDEESHFALTRAIVEEGKFEIDSFHNQTGDKKYHESHYYSSNSPGLPMISSFIYTLWEKIYHFSFSREFKSKNRGSNEYIIEKPRIIRYINPGFFILSSMILVTICTSSFFSALIVLLIYKFSKKFLKKGSEKRSIIILSGLGTPIFAYSLAFTGEIIATFLSFLSFYLLFRSRQTKKQRNYSNLLSGIFLGYSVTIHPLMIIALFSMFIYSLNKRNNKIKYFLAGISLGILPLLLYNYFSFGNFFGIFSYYVKLFYRILSNNIFPNKLTTEPKYFLKYNPFFIFLRILFYPSRGLFFYYPIFLISLIGLNKMKNLRKERNLIILLFILYLVANSLYFSWSGGLCFGPRYLVPITPFLIIPLTFVVKKINFKWILPLVILSIFFNFLGLQTLAPFLPEVPTIRQIKNLNSFKVLDNPIINHYLPLFIKNGPRSRIFEGLIDNKPYIDIRHWSPQFGDKDKYLKNYKIKLDLLDLSILGKINLNTPFLCMVPLLTFLFLIWYKEIKEKVKNTLLKSRR